MKLTKPLQGGYFTQRFGDNPQVYKSLGLIGHDGNDWATPENTPIYSAHDGVVVRIVNDSKLGRGILISSTTKESGIEKEDVYYCTMYWHLNRIDVTPNQVVKAGQQVGLSGNTGFSTGPHLHFGLYSLKSIPLYGDTLDVCNKNNGYKGAIDPLPFMDIVVNGEKIEKLSKKLFFGDKGDDVLRLQKFLSYFGYFDLSKMYNNFGTYTRDRLIDFQLIVMPTWNASEKNLFAQGKTSVGVKTLPFINNIL